jgi:hypothetical protein
MCGNKSRQTLAKLLAAVEVGGCTVALFKDRKTKSVTDKILLLMIGFYQKDGLSVSRITTFKKSSSCITSRVSHARMTWPLLNNKIEKIPKFWGNKSGS